MPEPRAILVIDSTVVQGRDNPTILTAQLISMVPPSWFSTTAKRRGGIFWTLMSSIGFILAIIKDNILLLKLQFRILTATGSTLDIISLDFLGSNRRTRLPRKREESDASFRSRIQSTLLRPHGTITGIKQSVKAITGAAPIVLENLNLNDYDSWTGVVVWNDTPKRFEIVPYLPFDATKSFLPTSLYNQTVLASNSILQFEKLPGIPGDRIFDFPAVGTLPEEERILGPLVWWFRGQELQTDFVTIGTPITLWRNAAPYAEGSADPNTYFRFIAAGAGGPALYRLNSLDAPCAYFGSGVAMQGVPASGVIGALSSYEWTMYIVVASMLWPIPDLTATGGMQTFLAFTAAGGRGGVGILGQTYDPTIPVATNTDGMVYDYLAGTGPNVPIDLKLKMPRGWPFLITIRTKLNGKVIGGHPQADLQIWVNGTGFVNTTYDSLKIVSPRLGWLAAPHVADFELWELMRYEGAHSEEQMDIVWEYLIGAHLITDGVPVPPAVPNLGTQALGAKELGSPYEFFVFSFQNPQQASDEAILDTIDRSKPVATVEHVYIIK